MNHAEVRQPFVPRLIQFVRGAPWTCLSLLVIAALHIGVLLSTGGNQPWSAALREWGAIQTLRMVNPPGNEPEIWEGYAGMFDLWSGAGWRIATSAWLHGSWWHVLLNGLALAQLGPLVERRSRWWVMPLLLGFAGPLSIAAEAVTGQAAVGISGGLCAIFGYLVAIRRDDPSLQRELPAESIRFVFGFLVLMVFLTWANWAAIANLAHAVGLIYGWSLGRVRTSGRAMRWGFAAAHAFAVPLFLAAVHPAHLANYQWYVSEQSDNLDERLKRLTIASEIDPALIGPWVIAAELRQFRGDRLGAWKTLLEGLRANRSSTALLKRALVYWRALENGPDGVRCRELLAEVFGSEAELWEEQLERAEFANRMDPDPYDLFDLASRVAGPIPDRYGLLLQVDILSPRSLKAPAVDPDRPGSAVEGESL